jgi:hypothetical protein
MKGFVGALAVVLALCWSTAAMASGYAALGDNNDLAVGFGGLYLSGDNATGDNSSEFLPTVNISGIADTWAWQAFYAFGDPATAFGGSVDYILASNFDECAECPDDNNGTWWFGIGPSAIHYESLFEDAAGAGGVGCSCFGGNLGFGWIMDNWNLQLYAHYLIEEEVLGFQASANYKF